MSPKPPAQKAEVGETPRDEGGEPIAQELQS